MLTGVKHRDFLRGHQSQYYSSLSALTTLGEGFVNGVASFVLNHKKNSIVKHAQARVVLGWVTSQEVLVLHPCEYQLDPMSAKCSIYSHEIWIHVESLLMKHESMSLNQNHIVKS